MQSKKSLFNQTLFQKNLTRFAPIWVMYLLCLMMNLPIMLLFELKRAEANAIGDTIEAVAAEKIWDVLYACTSGSYLVLAATFAMAIGLSCFGYLFQTRSAYMMHAFPVTRKELYCTNALSAVAMLWGPQIIAALLAVVEITLYHSGGGAAILVWLLYNMLYGFIFVSIAIFSCMLTAQVFFAPCMYLFWLVGVDAIRMAAMAFFANFMYGASPSVKNSSIFSPAVYLMQHTGFDQVSSYAEVTGKSLYTCTVPGYGTFGTKGHIALFAFAVFALVLLLVSWYIYKLRQMEVTGELLSMNWLRPVFRWIFAFAASVGIGAVLYGSFFYDSYGNAFLICLILALAVGFVCFFVAQMLLKKSPKVFEKKLVMEYAALLLVTWALMFSMNADLFGITGKIPEVSEVESVNIDHWTYATTSDPELIADIIALHQKCIDSKDYVLESLRQDPDNYGTVFLNYQLKDGSSLIRSYYLPSSEKDYNDKTSLINAAFALENSSKFVENYIFENDGRTVTMISGDVDYPVIEENGLDYSYSSVSLNAEQAQGLYAAIEKDIQAGNMPQAGPDLDLYSNSIHFNYYKGSDHTNSYYCYIQISEKSTNTLQALKRLGILKEEQLIQQSTLDELYE